MRVKLMSCLAFVAMVGLTGGVSAEVSSNNLKPSQGAKAKFKVGGPHHSLESAGQNLADATGTVAREHGNKGSIKTGVNLHKLNKVHRETATALTKSTGLDKKEAAMHLKNLKDADQHLRDAGLSHNHPLAVAHENAKNALSKHIANSRS